VTTLDIDIAACRGRQQRLLEVMRRRELDLIVVTKTEHVQWIAGPRFAPTFEPAAALAADGRVTLAAPARFDDEAAADNIVSYQAKWHSTMRNDQRQASSEALLAALSDGARARRVGVEYSAFPTHLARGFRGRLQDIEPDLYRLRRRKDPDELARLRKAIAATEKMYQRARQIIAPGVSELHVFNELQAAAVEEFGEMLTGTGNDYQCASRGGPPRPRQAEAGELYILDLGPAFRGYFADNARTIAVTEPTVVQQEAWRRVTEVLAMVEEEVKPGVSCRAVFEKAQAMLDEAPVGEFNHHLGHGIGLFPHEAPHLNPNWDDTFRVGEVFTAEPGLYDPQLNAGMRIENDYLVTENGVENLSPFPLELKL